MSTASSTEFQPNPKFTMQWTSWQITSSDFCRLPFACTATKLLFPKNSPLPPVNWCQKEHSADTGCIWSALMNLLTSLHSKNRALSQIAAIFLQVLPSLATQTLSSNVKRNGQLRCPDWERRTTLTVYLDFDHNLKTFNSHLTPLIGLLYLI